MISDTETSLLVLGVVLVLILYLNRELDHLLKAREENDRLLTDSVNILARSDTQLSAANKLHDGASVLLAKSEMFHKTTNIDSASHLVDCVTWMEQNSKVFEEDATFRKTLKEAKEHIWSLTMTKH